MFRILALAACALAAACTVQDGKPATSVTVAVEEAPRWRRFVHPTDGQRLDALPASWSSLYARLPARIRSAQSPLADPGAALEHPTPSPGAYSCRKLRLRADPRSPAVRSAASDSCYIAAVGETLAFTKQSGADLSSGYLYLDGNRYVYLGARQYRAGDSSVGYGEKPGGDTVGILERVGGFRWRLVMAKADTSQVDIFELTPVPADQQPRQSPVKPG